MNSELIVIAFPDEKDASVAESALRMMRERHLLGLQYAACVSKDSIGNCEIHLQLTLPVSLEDHRLAQLCQFANSICESDTESLRRLVEEGMEKTFLEGLREAMVPGTSALLIFAPPEEPADIQIVRTILSMFRGNLFHATFPPNVDYTLFAHKLNPPPR